MTVWAIVCLVFIPSPDSAEFHIWEKVIELACIPLFGYIFNRAFLSRGEVTNKQLTELTTAAKKTSETITKLEQGQALMEQAMRQEISDRRELESDFKTLQRDVDRGNRDRTGSRY